MDIERIAARLVADKRFFKQDGSELSSKEVKFIKSVAEIMKRPWQAIAARPADSAILLAEIDKGAEAAAEAYRKHKNAAIHGAKKQAASHDENVAGFLKALDLVERDIKRAREELNKGEVKMHSANIAYALKRGSYADEPWYSFGRGMTDFSK